MRRDLKRDPRKINLADDGEYFDGDSEDYITPSGVSVTHAWTGTPHASPSTQTLVTPQHWAPGAP